MPTQNNYVYYILEHIKWVGGNLFQLYILWMKNEEVEEEKKKKTILYEWH